VPDLSALAQDFMQKQVPLFTAPWRVKLDLEAAGCSASLVSPATVRCSKEAVQWWPIPRSTPLRAASCCPLSCNVADALSLTHSGATVIHGNGNLTHILHIASTIAGPRQAALCWRRPIMRRLMRSAPGQPSPAAAMSPEEAVEMLRFCFADLWDPEAPAPVQTTNVVCCHLPIQKRDT